jgi:hypothetical protein
VSPKWILPATDRLNLAQFHLPHNGNSGNFNWRRSESLLRQIGGNCSLKAGHHSNQPDFSLTDPFNVFTKTGPSWYDFKEINPGLKLLQLHGPVPNLAYQKRSLCLKNNLLIQRQLQENNYPKSVKRDA